MVYRAFHNLEQLEVLDLSNCGLNRKILDPHVFAGNYDPTLYQPLKNLRVLKLSTNVIHSLDSDTFEHMNALEELDLHENPFIVIDRQTELAISSLGENFKVSILC